MKKLQLFATKNRVFLILIFAFLLFLLLILPNRNTEKDIYGVYCNEENIQDIRLEPDNKGSICINEYVYSVTWEYVDDEIIVHLLPNSTRFDIYFTYENDQLIPNVEKNKNARSGIYDIWEKPLQRGFKGPVVNLDK